MCSAHYSEQTEYVTDNNYVTALVANACRAWGVRFQEHPPLEAEIQTKSHFVLQVKCP